MPQLRHSIGKRIGRTWEMKLTRVKHGDTTLHFTFKGFGAGRSNTSFVDKEDVPEFEGDEAWFEIEQISAKPWPFWRAIRQIDPPGPPVRKYGLART